LVDLHGLQFRAAASGQIRGTPGRLTLRRALRELRLAPSALGCHVDTISAALTRLTRPIRQEEWEPMAEQTATAGRGSGPGGPAGSGGVVDRFFRVSERGSSYAREARGGLATFFTMAYILVLNPIILGGAKDKFGHTLDHVQLVTATAVVAGVMTLIMG